MDTQIGYEQLQYAVWTVSYSNQIPSRYAQNRIWADSLNEAEVAQIRIEKIRFHAVCAVHTVMTKTDLSHMWAKKKIRFGPHLPAV